MPTMMDDQLQAPFNQGELLRNNHPYKTAVHKGVCLSLVVEWMKSQALGTANARMQRLTQNLNLCVGRQMIYSSGLKATKTGTVSAFLTALGCHYGLSYAQTGSYPTEFGLQGYLATLAGVTRQFMCEMKFTGGGAHAIGIISGDETRVFDPNFGEFACTLGTDDEDFWMSIALQFNDDPHASASRFVADIGDPLHRFIAH